MRRLIIAVLVSIAALSPGVASRLEQDREPRRGRGREGELDLPTRRQSRFQHEARSRGVGFDALGLCVPSFGTDISPLFFNAPGNGWVAAAADCSAVPGCDDYLVLSCPPGELVQASLCSHGGDAAWNTNLSVWSGGSQELCEDDSCGLQTEVAYPHSGAPYQRLRIGGTNDDSGPYSLAVNIPANCLVGPPIGVELQQVVVD